MNIDESRDIYTDMDMGMGVDKFRYIYIYMVKLMRWRMKMDKHYCEHCFATTPTTACTWTKAGSRAFTST